MGAYEAKHIEAQRSVMKSVSHTGEGQVHASESPRSGDFDRRKSLFARAYVRLTRVPPSLFLSIRLLQYVVLCEYHQRHHIIDVGQPYSSADLIDCGLLCF